MDAVLELLRADLVVQLVPEPLLHLAEVLPRRRQIGLDLAQLLHRGGLLLRRALGVVLGVHVELLRVPDHDLGRLLWALDLVHGLPVLLGDDLREGHVV